MTFIIETGIPIPPKRRGGGGKRDEYITEVGAVIKSLEVGQSFFTASHDVGQIRRICAGRRRHQGMCYATREIDGGVRVWRVE